MEALEQSAELTRRGDKLRARSVQIRGVVGQQVADSRRLITAAAEAREAMRHAHVPGSVQIVDPAPRDSPRRPDASRPGPMPLETEALVRRSQEARARARATREEILRGRSRREVLHDSAFARLQAKQETMAAI